MLYVNPLESLSRARLEGETLAPARRKAAFEEFERIFLFQLLREMRKTVPDSALFAESAQKEFMEEMLDDHLAGVMSASGQLGVARQMEQQMQGVTPDPLKSSIPDLKPINTYRTTP